VDPNRTLMDACFCHGIQIYNVTFTIVSHNSDVFFAIVSFS